MPIVTSIICIIAKNKRLQTLLLSHFLLTIQIRFFDPKGKSYVPVIWGL